MKKTIGPVRLAWWHPSIGYWGGAIVFIMGRRRVAIELWGEKTP